MNTLADLNRQEEARLFEQNVAVIQRGLDLKMPEAFDDGRVLLKKATALAQGGNELYRERVERLVGVLNPVADKVGSWRESGGLPTMQAAERGRDHDPIRTLADRGVIDVFEQRAATEIRTVYEGVTKPLSMRGSSLEPRTSGGRINDLPVSWRVANDYHRAFKPWIDLVRERGIPLPLVFDVVLYDKPIRKVREAYRMSHKSVIGHLKAALALYPKK